MNLGNIIALLARISALKAVFVRTQIGSDVELTGFELRLFGGRWMPVFRRLK